MPSSSSTDVDEDFRRTGATTSLWRSSSSLEFRPLPAVTARWDALSLRDLRDYGGLTPTPLPPARSARTWWVSTSGSNGNA
jgi:hypothetical protein